MVFHTSWGWTQSTLATTGADKRKIAAASWSSGGVSKWSLSYSTSNGRLYTITQTGASTGNWENTGSPYDLGSSSGLGGLAAAANPDGENIHIMK